MSLKQKLQRTFAFVRHMPARKIARRVELDVKRRVRDHLSLAPRTSDAPAPAVSSLPPQPLFAPRQGLMRLDDGKLHFRFVGRTISMPSGQIDWLAPGPGARDQLWRMNLHYMEYLEAADDEAFARFIESWITDNPVHDAGVWRDSWNSYALSLRTLVWMQQLARRSSSIPGTTVARIHNSLAEQLRFLEHNLETDLGGNHLIKNIKALAWASSYFSGAEADHWRSIALDLLEHEIAHQILPDGFQDERSPSYHAQVFADLLECRHALRCDPFSGRLDATLQRMAQVLADMTHPDGGAALFNDAGLTMAYAPGECLMLYAATMGETPHPLRVFSYPQAGYFGLRRDGTYLCVDCGRIAPDDLPAHGHGDVLSFEWSVAGRRIIVDQGVFEYVAGDKRQMARAASSHNTLSLEGADQADFFGAFRCGRRPDVKIHTWEPKDSGFILEGSHNGFAHLPGKPIHVRRFDADASSLHITDRIEGSTDRVCRASFLLHPDVGVELAGNEARLTSGAVSIRVNTGAALRTEAAVWWPDMGIERPTTRLILGLEGGSMAQVSFKAEQTQAHSS